MSKSVEQSSFLNSGMANDEDKIASTRIPVIVWVIIVSIITIVWQTMSTPILLQSVIFGIVMLLHIYLYWRVNQIIRHSRSIYVVIQGMLIFGSAMLMSDGFPAVLIGLIPVLIGQTITIFYETAKVVLIALCLYFCFIMNIYLLKGAEELAVLIPLLLLMIIVVVAYAVLFYRQVNARFRTQTFLLDLELAHQKVEELTLANERQRIARDLHDTLAQGLAGVIMQLEAVDAHLGKGRTERAHEIIINSMGQARETLADARKAIDNLRSRATPSIDFSDAVNDTIDRFVIATGIKTDITCEINRPISGFKMEHILHIVSESLMNVARHAQANKVRIIIEENRKDELRVCIQDNGRGFNVEKIGKQSGHYGLIGIHERARLIGGQIQIESQNQGTVIKLILPL
ncbi:histidine kinase [Paenibacillus sp. Root52]|uniref:histidine kinase n=1 Tax=Paenibacillus amylolyticus TaxID=1451 RepID=A0AAP5GWK0_PAEAM|nr:MULTISPECIES: sensor histidine kinase [Paenibacillus]KQY94372.1 histidine kinase [Paenibacillus sp. Root52]MDR6721647.1 NarL family two-component system sensor histidine kinase YdfH [Paenibacillus amylolyticus]